MRHFRRGGACGERGVFREAYPAGALGAVLQVPQLHFGKAQGRADARQPRGMDQRRRHRPGHQARRSREEPARRGHPLEKFRHADAAEEGARAAADRGHRGLGEGGRTVATGGRREGRDEEGFRSPKTQSGALVLGAGGESAGARGEKFRALEMAAHGCRPFHPREAGGERAEARAGC